MCALEAQIDAWGSNHADIVAGSRFRVEIEPFDDRSGESNMAIELLDTGSVMYMSDMTAGPFWLQLGEAIRRAVVETLNDQITAFIEERDRMLCEILQTPMPSTEQERTLRGVRVRERSDV